MFELKTLEGILSRFDWKTDVIELLVIGVAVYAMVRFLRGTRGARLVRGFTLVLITSTMVLYLLANALSLERIQVLYPPFVTAMFLIALVAFQPELRRALIRLGAAGWLGGSKRELDNAIEEVVNATASLSKNRIGAILAFERATEFGGLIESGCRLDSEVTARALMTIFWPGSPLHDMGVVIAQGRIAAAGVQFPLTESVEMDETLGSRHRAAVGLSEETDALVVVVSEETGTLSLVEDGKLYRFLTSDTLRQMLRTKLGLLPKDGA